MAVDAEPELYEDLGVHEDESGDEGFDEELEQVIQQEHSKFLQQQADYYEQLQANRSWKVVPLASPGPAVQLQREEQKQEYAQVRQASGSIEETSERVEYVPPSRPADLPPSFAHLLPPDPSRPRSALPRPADAEDELYGLVEAEGYAAVAPQHADEEDAAAEAAPAGDAEGAMVAKQQQEQQQKEEATGAEEEGDEDGQLAEEVDIDHDESLQLPHQPDITDSAQPASDASSLGASRQASAAGTVHPAAAEAPETAAEQTAGEDLLPELPAEASGASPSPVPDPHSVSSQFSHWASEPSSPELTAYGEGADEGKGEAQGSAEGESEEQLPAASSSNSAGAAAIEVDAHGPNKGTGPEEQHEDEQQTHAEGTSSAKQQQQQQQQQYQVEVEDEPAQQQQQAPQPEDEVPQEDAAEAALQPQEPGEDEQGSSNSSSSGGEGVAQDNAAEEPRSWPLARVTVSAEASAATAASVPAEAEAPAEDAAVAADAAVCDAQPADLQEDLDATAAAAAPAAAGVAAKDSQAGAVAERPPSRLSAAGSVQHLGGPGSTSSIPGWSKASAGGHLSSREGSSSHVPTPLYADTSVAVAGALDTLLEDFSTAPSRMSVSEGAGPGARGSTHTSAAGRLGNSREVSSSHVPHALHADTSAAVAGALDTLLEDFSTGPSQVSVVGGSSPPPAAARRASASRMSKEPSAATAERMLPSNASRVASTHLQEDSSGHLAAARTSAAGRRASAEASMPRMPGHVPSDTSVAVAGALHDLLQDYSTASAAPSAVHATSSTASAAAAAPGSGLAACEEEQEEEEQEHAAAESEVSAASHPQPLGDEEDHAAADEQHVMEAEEGGEEPTAAAHEQEEQDAAGVVDAHAEAASDAAADTPEPLVAGDASTQSSDHPAAAAAAAAAAAGEHSAGLEESGNQHSFAARSSRSQASRSSSGGPYNAPHTAYNMYERPQTAIAGPRGGRRPVSAYAGGRSVGSAAAAAAVYSQGGSSSGGADSGSWDASGRQHRGPSAQAGGPTAAGRHVGTSGVQRPFSAGSNRPRTAPAAASYLRGGTGGLYGNSEWDNYQKPIYGWTTYHPLDSVHRPATAASCTATYSSRPASPPVAPLSVTQGPGVSARGLRTYMSDILLKLKQANRYCQILGAPWRYSLEAPNTAVLRNQMRVIMWPYGDGPGMEGSAGSSQQNCDIWSADMEEQQSSSSSHQQQQQDGLPSGSEGAEEEVYTPDEASACSSEAAAGAGRSASAGHSRQGASSPAASGVAGKRPASPGRRLTLSLTLFYQRHEQLQAQVQHLQQMQQRATQAAQQDAVLLQNMLYSQQLQQQQQQQQHNVKQIGPWEGSYDSKLQEASHLSEGHSDEQIKAYRPQTAFN